MCDRLNQPIFARRASLVSFVCLTSRAISIIIPREDSTYDHRLRRTWYPVRSALIKPQIDRLVVGWVTTSESRLLYVFFLSFRSERYWREEWCGVDLPSGLNSYLSLQAETVTQCKNKVSKVDRGKGHDYLKSDGEPEEEEPKLGMMMMMIMISIRHSVGLWADMRL